MNLVEQMAHIVKREDPRLQGQLFRELKDNPDFTLINHYDLNDLLYDKLAWMPPDLSIDSKELIQVNIRTIPVSRSDDGTLRIFHSDTMTYWPDLNEISNSYGALHDMVHAATIRHVISWDLRINQPELRSEQSFGYDQLRENFDMVVAGAGLNEFEDHRWNYPRTTNHLTITVVLLLTPGLMELISTQKQLEIAVCDNHLRQHEGAIELEDNDNGPFYNFLRTAGFDNTVLLAPGAN